MPFIQYAEACCEQECSAEKQPGIFYPGAERPVPQPGKYSK